jgi:hypothetical protein
MDTAITRGALPRISWSGVIAGAVAALGVQIVLGLFGVALGLAGGPGANTWSFIGGIWGLIVPFIATFVGAAIAVRMSSVDHAGSNMVHGFLVWALGIICGALFLTGTLASGAMSASNAASGNAGTVQRNVPAFSTDRIVGRAAGTTALAGLSGLLGLCGGLLGAASSRRSMYGRKERKFGDRRYETGVGTEALGEHHASSDMPGGVYTPDRTGSRDLPPNEPPVH